MTVYRTVLAVLLGLAIPLSTALTNILAPLILILVLFEGQYQQKFKLLAYHALAVPALMLFALMLLGLLYTPAPFEDAVLMLDKYRELIYIPLLILLFQQRSTRQWGLYAFLTAMGITLVLSYLMAYGGWELGKGDADNPFVFKNHITQGTLLALAAYLVACWPVHKPYLRGIQILTIALAIYNVVFMIQSRTGYVVVASLMILFLYQHYRLRGIVLGGIAVIVLAVVAYLSSETVHQRIENFKSGLEHYQAGETLGSIPARVEFVRNSLSLLAQNPILGHGTGSFNVEYQHLAEQKAVKPTTNPHNEYLMLAVQWGILGAGLFIYLLVYMWRTASRQLMPIQAQQAQGVVIAIAVGCLFNSLLLDNTEGHLLAYLIGVFYGGAVPEPRHIKRCVGWCAPLKRCDHYADQKWAALPYFCAQHQSQLLIVFVFILISYHVFTRLPQQLNTVIDPQTLQVLLNTMQQLSRYDQNVSFPIETQTEESIIKTITQWQKAELPQVNPFQTALKIKPHLPITLSLADEIELKTKIDIAQHHVGQAAHILVIALFRPLGTEASMLLQPQQQRWLPLNNHRLNSQHYYPQLPPNIEIPIYNGHLQAAGALTVFVGYLLSDGTWIMNQNPTQLKVINE